MTAKSFDIWGSCVTRDAFEFALGATVGRFCARQSIVSSVADPVDRSLIFNGNVNQFLRRAVEEDFQKTSLDKLVETNSDAALVIDLIEERVPIGVTHCGTYLTLSSVASDHTNAKSLCYRLIPAFSNEHVELFQDAIKKFAARVSHRKIVIHKALYADGNWHFKNQNRVLNKLYDLVAQNLSSAIVIEVDKKLRVASPTHKWKSAPYHYTDEYYRQFVQKLAAATGTPISVNSICTMQTDQ